MKKLRDSLHQMSTLSTLVQMGFKCAITYIKNIQIILVIQYMRRVINHYDESKINTLGDINGGKFYS